MTIVSGLMVYLVLWWIVIFAVLPWGVQPISQIPQDSSASDPDGCDAGAPQHPYMKQKFIITTMIAGVLWWIVKWFIESDIVSFSE